MPPSRDHSGMIYLQETDSLYIFGGRASSDSKDSLLNDMWQFDFTHMEWTELSPTGPTPSPRFLFSYVPWNGLQGTGEPQLLVYGGSGFDEQANSLKFNDAYLYSFRNNAWTMFLENNCDDVNDAPNLFLGNLFMQILVGLSAIVLVVGLIFAARACHRTLRHYSPSQPGQPGYQSINQR